MSLLRFLLFAVALAFSAMGPGAVGSALAQSPPPRAVPPPQQFDYPHSGNSTPDATTSCPSSSPPLPIWDYGDVADNVKAMARATNSYLQNCHCPDAACVADALDNFAAALAAVGPRLPPQVADLPFVVRQAARKIRVARTAAQAHAAIHEAIATISAKLKLLRVDDPDARSDGARSANFINGTLSVADLELTRISGI